MAEGELWGSCGNLLFTVQKRQWGTWQIERNKDRKMKNGQKQTAQEENNNPVAPCGQSFRE